MRISRILHRSIADAFFHPGAAMKLLTSAALAIILCGCGLQAQNNGTKVSDGPLISRARLEIGRWTCNPGMDIWKEHFDGVVPECIDAEHAHYGKPDGAPPRWVEPSAGCIITELNSCYGRWECSKGFHPDGVRVTWPSGMFHAEPERCAVD